MARLIAYTVYDSKMFGIGHNIRRWADALEIRYVRNAKDEAPVYDGYKPPNRLPPGSLKESISGGVKRVGVRRLAVTISVNVDYATHVIRGTGGAQGYIQARNPSKPMRVPIGPGIWIPRMRVKGQDPNDFLDRAHARTAIRHPSLRRAELHHIGFRRTGQLGQPL